jgi:hypothetical protein
MSFVIQTENSELVVYVRAESGLVEVGNEKLTE